MICITPKLSKKISEIIEVSLEPPSSPDLNLLDYVTWGVFESKKKKKKCIFPSKYWWSLGYVENPIITTYHKS